MPDGKIISFNNSLYYNNNQPVGKSTINIYTVSLNNFTINGWSNTPPTTLLPIQNINNRLIEYWEISNTSNTVGVGFVESQNYYCHIESREPSTIYCAHTLFHNQYAISAHNICYPIGTNIYMGSTSSSSPITINIKYSCIYIA